MRVERGQHALDGGADQRLLVGCIDIFGADAVEHLTEEIEVLIDLVGAARMLRVGRRRRERRVGRAAHSTVRPMAKQASRLGRRCLVLRKREGCRRCGEEKRDKGGAREGQTHRRLSTLGRGFGRSPPPGRVDGRVLVSHFNIKGRALSASAGGDCSGQLSVIPWCRPADPSARTGPELTSIRRQAGEQDRVVLTCI